MPKTSRKTKKTVSGKNTTLRLSPKVHRMHRRAVPEQIGTTAGRLVENVVAEVAETVAPRSEQHSTLYVATGSRNGLFDFAVRVTGGALALVSILIAAPILSVAQAVIASGDLNIEVDDLKSREYVDEAGRTHHHTRTFFRDHPAELRTLTV